MRRTSLNRQILRGQPLDDFNLFFLAMIEISIDRLNKNIKRDLS